MIPSKNKISVVIPVHNGARTLAECLNSVTKQIRPADEIIIVDNASADQTPDIIKDFASRHHYIRGISEKKRGRGPARNAGLQAARGEIIAMTDADCVVPPDWIAKIIEPIETENESVVMGFETDGINNYWSKRRQAIEYKFVSGKAKNGYVDFLDTKNFAIRAALLKDLGFNSDLKFCEDVDLFLRLKKLGLAIRFLPNLTVRHQHVASWRELASTQFFSAYYSREIHKLYQDDAALHDYLPIAEDPRHHRPLRRLISLLIWSALEIIHNPYEAPYTLTDDWAWKIGLLSHKIKKINLTDPADPKRPENSNR